MHALKVATAVLVLAGCGLLLPMPRIDPPGSIQIGQPAVLTLADSGNGGMLLAQSAVLDQPATIQTISFYVTTPSGKFRLGLYDASGPSGKPGQLKAQTNEIVPVVGWNNAPVIAQILLPAGTYWIAYHPSSAGLAFVKQHQNTAVWASRAYGALPNIFPATTGGESVEWSLYASLTIDATPVDAAPGAPTIAMAEVPVGKIDFAWDPVSLVETAGYRLFYWPSGAAPECPQGTAFVSTVDTHASVDGLRRDTEYQAQVAAVDMLANIGECSNLVKGVAQ